MATKYNNDNWLKYLYLHTCIKINNIWWGQSYPWMVSEGYIMLAQIRREIYINNSLGLYFGFYTVCHWVSVVSKCLYNLYFVTKINKEYILNDNDMYSVQLN